MKLVMDFLSAGIRNQTSFYQIDYNVIYGRTTCFSWISHSLGCFWTLYYENCTIGFSLLCRMNAEESLGKLRNLFNEMMTMLESVRNWIAYSRGIRTQIALSVNWLFHTEMEHLLLEYLQEPFTNSSRSFADYSWKNVVWGWALSLLLIFFKKWLPLSFMPMPFLLVW